MVEKGSKYGSDACTVAVTCDTSFLPPQSLSQSGSNSCHRSPHSIITIYQCNNHRTHGGIEKFLVASTCVRVAHVVSHSSLSHPQQRPRARACCSSLHIFHSAAVARVHAHYLIIPLRAHAHVRSSYQQQWSRSTSFTTARMPLSPQTTSSCNKQLP